MRRLVLTRAAQAHLVEIWVGSARHGEPAADRAIDRIAEGVRRLQAFPFLGKAHPEIAPDARVLVADRWLVLYKVTDAGVRVFGVVDGRRDPTDRPLDDNP